MIISWLRLVEPKELNGGEALDAIGGSCLLIGRHIYCSKMDHTLESFGGFFPSRGQRFAVAAPWGIELYEPQLVWLVQDKLLEVILGQLNHRG